VALNTAAVNALLDDGNDAALWLAVGDGPTAGDQTSVARVPATWSSPASGVLTATGVPYNFVGASDVGAGYLLVFSAATAGTFYGFELLDGDSAFSSEGDFQITALTLTATTYPSLPEVPTQAYTLGTAVGVPTGTTLTNRSSLGANTNTGTYTITNPETDETVELDVIIWEAIRFTQTITPKPELGEVYLFLDCSFEGQGNWCVEVDNTNHATPPDIMSPLVVFDHCSFDGDDATDKAMIGGYAWLVDSDMRNCEDGWAGWYYNAAIRSNLVGHGADEADHADGAQCLDTGHSVFSQCWLSATGPGANGAFRIGTEGGGASVDIAVLYCALDGGGWTVQSRGDSGGPDISDLRFVGNKWTRNAEFGPADFEETTDVTWEGNAYFDGEEIPSPV